MSTRSPARYASMRWHSVVLVALLHLPTVLAAETMPIGGTEISVPNPTGFHAVTPQMTALYGFQQRFIAPTNSLVRNYIPEGAIPVALSDEIPQLDRWFSIQVATSLLDQSISTSQFSILKRQVRTNQAEAVRKVEKSMPGLMDRLNDGIANEFGANPNFSIAQAVPFPVHSETERSIAYSMVTKYDMTDPSGRPSTYTTVGTMAFVLVKDKVLTLYVFAEPTALSWSREACERWIAALLQANPSDASIFNGSSTPIRSRQFDWGKVIEKSIGGASVWLLIGLVI